MIYILIYILIAYFVGCATYYYFCKEYKKADPYYSLDMWLYVNNCYDVIAVMAIFWFIAVPITLIIGLISFIGKLIRKSAKV